MLQNLIIRLPRLAATLALILSSVAGAQETPPGEDSPPSEAPKTVEVQPLAQDEEIAARLERILKATEWFEGVEVDVDEGVVFLRGNTSKQEYKEWAARLATQTQDVVAVVNRIEVAERSIWDFTPALTELQKLGKEAVQLTPLVVVALVLLALTWGLARLVVVAVHSLSAARIENKLLRRVSANLVAIPVFLLGLYLMLRISGLTQLALTVLGGTGLVGLVVGFAFRGIAENFLASVLISMHQPFQAGDLIEVEGHQGFVQQVTTRVPC